jgi:glycosyltransferase involved in cell wall biosynthesis
MWAHPKRPMADAPAAQSFLAATGRPSPVSILLVTNQFLPIVGGTEIATLREAQALKARGHPVRVLTLRHQQRWPASEEMDGVPVRRIGGFFLRGRLRMRFGATWLAEARLWYELVLTRRTYDVVQLRQLGRQARPVALAKVITGKPLLVRIACGPAPQVRDGDARKTSPNGASSGTSEVSLHVRGMPPDIGDVDTLRRIQLLAPVTLRLLRATGVTFLALSQRIQQQLVDSGVSEQRICLLPNGIDLTVYEEIAACRARRTPSAPGAVLTVLCPARLAYQKGQDVLLKAWRTVQEHIPAARLILAGDGPLRRQLERLAADLGVSDSVEFAGLVGDVRALLAAADGFVLPSRYEGMSNALLEAMATGLPCVATRVSGSEEVIVDGQSGLLVPPENPDALATALLTVLTDPERARTLGRSARARVECAFDQRRVMDQLSELYRSLVMNDHTRRHQPHSRSRGPGELRLGTAGRFEAGVYTQEDARADRASFSAITALEGD